MGGGRGNHDAGVPVEIHFVIEARFGLGDDTARSAPQHGARGNVAIGNCNNVEGCYFAPRKITALLASDSRGLALVSEWRMPMWTTDGRFTTVPGVRT